MPDVRLQGPPRAAGLEPEATTIAERARRWRFDHPTPEDEDLRAAVRRAAGYLNDNAGLLRVPDNPTQRAYLAARLHDLFPHGATPALEAVEARLSAP